MKAKFFSILIACLVVTSVFSQTSLNNYKYVIVPDKFDFLKEKDQYQLNSLAQFLFNKYGFEAFIEGTAYPEDLMKNRCLALTSDVVNDSGMFKTKLNVELKDCNNRVIFTSATGESKEKEYKVAYIKALRAAFKSVEMLNYKYEPNANITSMVTADTPEKSQVSEEIKQLKEEIQNLKKDKQKEPTLIEKPNVEPPKAIIPEPKSVEMNEVKEVAVIEGVSNVLYAQEIVNGFQLVDSSPKVVYRIKNTSLNNTFLVENTSAIIYKKDDNWVLEYYADDVLKQDILNIKF